MNSYRGSLEIGAVPKGGKNLGKEPGWEAHLLGGTWGEDNLGGVGNYGTWTYEVEYVRPHEVLKSWIDCSGPRTKEMY